MNWHTRFGALALVLALMGSTFLGSVYLTQATVSTTAPRNDYIGNGATATYSYTFRIFAASDLRVTTRTTAGVETALVYLTDYTVTGVNGANGGTITLTAGNLTTDYTLTIRFDRTPQQTTDLRNQGSFFPETHETKFDELTRYIQSIKDVVNRSLHFPETESTTDTDTQLPSIVERASKFLAFDADGLPIASAGGLSSPPVTAFMATVLDDTTAAAARTTLGVPTLAEAGVQADTVLRVTGSSDATKKLAFEVDALTTATTRTRFQVDEDASDGASWEAKNLTLVATVAASALTVALKTKNGTDPSATDPIIFKFRNVTVGTGTYTTVTLTAALSLVISSGSTMGTTSGVAHRLYLGITNDGGTLRLFVYNPLVAATLSLTGLDEGQVNSSTAEGGAGAADSAQVLYSGTAFTSKAIRLLGYMESTQATAGTWATTPSKIQILGPGVKRTGDIVQVASTQTGAVATGTTVVPDDDTIPQITEGDEFMTKAITPMSAVNLLSIVARGNYYDSGSNTVIQSLFQDATAGALAVSSITIPATQSGIIVTEHLMLAGTTSATTLRVRTGGQANTVTFNGQAGNRRFGGVISSSVRITEIMV